MQETLQVSSIYLHNRNWGKVGESKLLQPIWQSVCVVSDRNVVPAVRTSKTDNRISTEDM
jgi:hypothetical protein